PAITGETEKGRSIRVTRYFLPRNSNRAIAQAAATPNTRFRGTAIAAAISVSHIDARASGSEIAAQYSSKPLCSASWNTVASGSSRNSAKKPIAMPINSRRTQAGSSSDPAIRAWRADDAGNRDGPTGADEADTVAGIAL